MAIYLCCFRDGILFSIANVDPTDMTKAPPNIAFLEVLCEFTNKLMKQDKKTVYVLVQVFLYLYVIADRSTTVYHDHL